MTGWRVISTFGKALGALCGAGAVGAVAGSKGTLAVTLIAAGAAGAGVGVVADERVKALERRDLQRAADEEESRVAIARERTIASALRVPVCAVADVNAEKLGVDPVATGILEHALKVEGNQLHYVERDIDDLLRGHLGRAREGRGPALVCLHGLSKTGKSRSMLEGLRAELPDAAIVAPDRTRENLQTILDCGVLPQAAAQHHGLGRWRRRSRSRSASQSASSLSDGLSS